MSYFYNAFGNLVLLNNIETFADTSNKYEYNKKKIIQLTRKIKIENTENSKLYIKLLDLQKKILDIDNNNKKIIVKYEINSFLKNLNNIINKKDALLTQLKNINKEQSIEEQSIEEQSIEEQSIKEQSIEIIIFTETKNNLRNIKQFLISTNQIKKSIPIIKKGDQHKLLKYLIDKLKVIFYDIFNKYKDAKHFVKINTDYNIDEETTDNEFILNSFL